MSELIVTPLGTVSPYCKDNSNCPGFLVSDGNFKILLDCGNGVSRLINIKEDLKNLNIILSHLHKDHYGDLFSLAYASYILHQNGILLKPVSVYMPRIGTTNPQYNKYTFDESEEDYKFIHNIKEKFMNFSDYDDRSKLQIGNIKITFMQTHHSVRTYAVKLEMKGIKIVYSSDTGYKSIDEMIKFAYGADLFICESSLLKSDNIYNEFHLHAHEAGNIARLAHVKKLLLTHFWPETDKKLYLDEAKLLFTNTDIAVEGKSFVIGGNK